MGTSARALRPRAAFTFLHRYVGLAIAGFLIIASATGIPLAFNAELEALLSPELFRVAKQGRQTLTPDELIARVHRALPQLVVTGLNYRPGEHDSVRAYVEPRTDPASGRPHELGFDELFIDPYDGKVLGWREWGALRLDRAHVMPFLYKLHYTLHIPGQAGVILLGIAALMWMFDCFVGFYLTLPAGRARSRPAGTAQRRSGKTWWQRWKPAWLIKRKAGFVRINLDIHRAAGLWFWIVTFVLAMTSVSLNLSGEVARPFVGLFSELTPDPRESLSSRPEPTGAPRLTYADAVAAAHAALPRANANSVLAYLSYLPDKRAYWVAMNPADKDSSLFQFEYANVYVDAETGAVRAIKTYAGGRRGDKFLDWQLPLHTGQIFGLPGRILICISGFVVIALSVTGVVVWWKKRGARRTARPMTRV